MTKDAKASKEPGFTLAGSSVLPCCHSSRKPSPQCTTLPGFLKTHKLDQKLLLGKFELGPELSPPVPTATPQLPSCPTLLQAP